MGICLCARICRMRSNPFRSDMYRLSILVIFIHSTTKVPYMDVIENSFLLLRSAKQFVLLASPNSLVKLANTSVMPSPSSRDPAMISIPSYRQYAVKIKDFPAYNTNGAKKSESFLRSHRNSTRRSLTSSLNCSFSAVSAKMNARSILSAFGDFTFSQHDRKNHMMYVVRLIPSSRQCFTYRYRIAFHSPIRRNPR
jgi:hypothetical protein